MLQVLLEAGIFPDLVVGASVGAINGVRFAAAPNARGAAQLAEIWRRIGRRGVVPVSPTRSIRALLGGGTSEVTLGGTLAGWMSGMSRGRRDCRRQPSLP